MPVLIFDFPEPSMFSLTEMLVSRVSRFNCQDGKEKIQLRVDVDLLQMNGEGRPDGKHPFGHESLYEHYQSQLEKYRAAHNNDDEGYQMKMEDIGKMQQEAIQYHHRYIC